MISHLVSTWASAATPPPLLTVSEWADANRRLPETSSARGARWRTDLTPYLRGIMNAVHEPGVTKVALRKCAQVGGSEAINNILGFFIEHDPCPILLVQPTESVAEEWSKERFGDMVRSTPTLRDVIRDKRSGGGAYQDESTLSFKLFPGGFLALGGANTPNTFARRAARVVIGDDVDRWPAVVGVEGDPTELLGPRVETFDDGIIVMVSTPTLKGGRIDTLYERSDQRRYVVACPSCGRRDWITWSDPSHLRVVYEGDDPRTAHLECPDLDNGGCGVWIDEPSRRQMILEASVEPPFFGWEPTALAKEPGLIGFHLPAMVATLGRASLSSLVGDWLSARQLGKESTRVFINTRLGEGWEDRAAKADPHAVMRRREDYGDDVEVPAGAVILTAGVDVQVDRFEVQVIGWGFAGERWVVDWRVVMGDPRSEEDREELRVALERTYRHASGHELPIFATFIDTGYATDDMYAFVLRYQVRRIFASKGIGRRSGEPIILAATEKRRGQPQKKRPVRVHLVNTDDAKRDVMSSVNMAEPGPGAMHFPLQLESINEEYFAQLCAEHEETKFNKSKVATHREWVQDRERNEALDTAVMALAAFKHVNVNLRQFADRLTEPLPTGEPSSPVSHTVRRKNWLGPRRRGWLKG